MDLQAILQGLMGGPQQAEPMGRKTGVVSDEYGQPRFQRLAEIYPELAPMIERMKRAGIPDLQIELAVLEELGREGGGAQEVGAGAPLSASTPTGKIMRGNPAAPTATEVPPSRSAIPGIVQGPSQGAVQEAVPAQMPIAQTATPISQAPAAAQVAPGPAEVSALPADAASVQSILESISPGISAWELIQAMFGEGDTGIPLGPNAQAGPAPVQDVGPTQSAPQVDPEVISAALFDGPEVQAREVPGVAPTETQPAAPTGASAGAPPLAPNQGPAAPNFQTPPMPTPAAPPGLPSFVPPQTGQGALGGMLPMNFDPQTLIQMALTQGGVFNGVPLDGFTPAGRTPGSQYFFPGDVRSG